MCGQLMPLKFSSTSWEYCSKRVRVCLEGLSQNVAVTCAAFAFE